MPDLLVTTFHLPAAVGGDTAVVVGDFNGWAEDGHPMERTDDGFSAAIPLEPGRTYRFRYLIDGMRWENDWAADAYVPNDFGGDDSVIDLRDAAPSAAAAAPPAAKAPAAKKARATTKKAPTAPPEVAPEGDAPVAKKAPAKNAPAAKTTEPKAEGAGT